MEHLKIAAKGKVGQLPWGGGCVYSEYLLYLYIYNYEAFKKGDVHHFKDNPLMVFTEIFNHEAL